MKTQEIIGSARKPKRLLLHLAYCSPGSFYANHYLIQFSHFLTRNPLIAVETAMHIYFSFIYLLGFEVSNTLCSSLCFLFRSFLLQTLL